MDLRYFILILLLSQVTFAGCSGYIEDFNVRVLDAQLRPIEGAGVSITYDRGSGFGTQYFTTPVNYTDVNGLAPYRVVNQGTNTRTIDCNIIANASAGGRSNTTIVIAQQHGNPIDVFLSDVYPVRFYVKDQFGAGIVNASVTIGNITRKTDGQGLAKFYYKKGNYSYLASSLDGSQAGSIEIK
ncbi:hypothetical protein HZC07_03465, partial [Candidatus Micrarchaeota archaeon]|nr:hypothetical protein [Candidatus Micrarchaeota archaeon]